jgi:putative ABC transport system permease protein
MMDRESRSGGRMDRLYRILLRAYPPTFRERFGAEMREAFRDGCAGALRQGGRLRWASFVSRAIVDALRNGLMERLTDRGRQGRGGGRAFSGAFRQAGRRLVRSPAFAVATIASVGLGVGAFASVASVADGVLLDALPYASPDRLVWVWRDYTWADFPRGWLGGPDIVALREREDVFEGVVAFRSGRANLGGEGGATPEEARLLLASDDFFETLGARPLLGRGFEPGESVPEAEPVAVLSHELWRRRWNADPGILGERILVDGEPWTVVGVMPPGFRFVKHSSLGDPEPADLYGTLRMDLASSSVGTGAFAGLARIRPGVNDPAVEGALGSVATELDEFFGNKGLRLWAVDLKSDLVDEIAPALVALSFAALFLLLILGANLATLLYGRAEQRSRDVAVRAALGGSRLAAVSGLIIESVIVAAVGCAIGLVVARFAIDGLLALAPPSLPRREAIDLDASVIGGTIGLALLTGLVAAAGPAFRVSGRAAAQVLRATDPRAGGSGARTRSALVVIQVALSLVLLVGAGLVGRSAQLLLATRPGFDASGVMTWRVSLDDLNYPDSESSARLHSTYLAEIGSMPGIVAAGATTALPLSGDTDQGPVQFPGADGNTGDADADAPLIDDFVITPGYLEAMRIRVLAGRPFGESDAAGAPHVALIDRTLAERFFPGSSPVGRTALYAGDTLEIVGVVDQARLYNVYSDDRGQIYLPAAQWPPQTMYYAARTGGDPGLVLPQARNALRRLDPSLPLAEARSGESLVRDSLGRHRLTLTLLGVFALGALFLAAMGIYGVVAGGVIRRTPEIGVRLALGASGSGVLRLVAADAMRVVAAGLVLGLIAAVAASRLLESLLFGVEPGDPVTYGGVAVFLFAVATLSCVVPALRAVRIPPTRALRGE